MFHPPWFEQAERVASENDWTLIELPTGQLAFKSRNGQASAIIPGNDAGGISAIARAAALMPPGLTLQVPPAGSKPMSLAEKMATLAARSQAIPKALEARADALLPRLDALEKMGATSFTGLETVIADAEKGVAAAEAAMRQLSNGAPLTGSGS